MRAGLVALLVLLSLAACSMKQVCYFVPLDLADGGERTPQVTTEQDSK